jgi:hypothetical protein
LDEQQIVDRLDRAILFIRFIVGTWAVKLTKALLENAGYNVIYLESFAADQGAGNNPAATYPTALWSLAPDEALILECEVPRAPYWGVQLGDIHWQVLDYTYHQTSLNGHQAHLDRDGRFRAVVSHKDPGVANWLDPIGNEKGILIFRFYRAEQAVTPSIQTVRLSELRDHLPEGTPSMSPAQRSKSLKARSHASKQRYGF